LVGAGKQMAFSDILFDEKKLVKALGPAAWGQGFKEGRGAGISLDRVIDCLEHAKVEPDPDEGYTQVSSTRILVSLFQLTMARAPLCKSGADIRARLSDVIEANTKHFSSGEKALLSALENMRDDEQKLRLYLVFQEELDRLLISAAIPARFTGE